MKEEKKTVCACVPYTAEEVRRFIRTQKLKGVQDVLAELARIAAGG